MRICCLVVKTHTRSLGYISIRHKTEGIELVKQLCDSFTESAHRVDFTVSKVEQVKAIETILQKYNIAYYKDA